MLPLDWVSEGAEPYNPRLCQPAAPGEGGSAPPSDLGRGLLNLLFARFVPGIKSNKLMPDSLILSFFEEFRAFTEL